MGAQGAAGRAAGGPLQRSWDLAPAGLLSFLVTHSTCQDYCHRTLGAYSPRVQFEVPDSWVQPMKYCTNDTERKLDFGVM